MAECRRCSECRGQMHHWCTEIRTDDGERLQCKHCDATAAECEMCDGSGGDDCTECEGTGLVDIRDPRGPDPRLHTVQE